MDKFMIVVVAAIFATITLYLFGLVLFKTLFYRFFNVVHNTYVLAKPTYMYIEKDAVDIICFFWFLGIPLFSIYFFIRWMYEFLTKRLDIVVIKVFGPKKQN